MKCKRCERDMKRVKISDNNYIYLCPGCGNRIGGNTHNSVSTTDEAEKTEEE